MRFSNILLASSLVVSAGCEFFNPTTVPASDTSAPWAVVSLYLDGDHEEMAIGNKSLAEVVNGTQFQYVTTNPAKVYIALAAGVDAGGVSEVQMHSRVTAQCIYGPLNHQILEPWTQQTATQDGAPGETVENGLYTAKVFRGYDWVPDLDFCPDGNHRVDFEWYARAEDFHGNVAFYGRGKVIYMRYAS